MDSNRLLAFLGKQVQKHFLGICARVLYKEEIEWERRSTYRVGLRGVDSSFSFDWSEFDLAYVY